MRPDGTLLLTKGYDPTTGLLFEWRDAFLPSIAHKPTRDNAIAARNLLLGPLCDFPFAEEVHRAAWLAACLTPLARFAYSGPAPLFLVDANVRGAGKGLLLDCISRIVTGEQFTVATYTQDEDELRKRITSLALTGERMVLFDNLDGRFGNATLDAALTATSWEDRMLGVNRMVRAPLYMTWYATGNNVAISADTARRVCHVRLDSPCERPETRSDFKQANLLEWVRQNRSKLLAAALTILRGYAAAGYPDQRLPAWGSFDSWSRIIRGAVVWCGMEDPGKTRILLQDLADVEAENMGILLACLEKMDSGRKGLTAAGIIAKAREEATYPDDGLADDLRSSIEALVGKMDSRALGTRLRHYRRRIFQGRFVDSVGVEHKAVRWASLPATEFNKKKSLPEVSPSEGESGESGEWF